MNTFFGNIVSACVAFGVVLWVQWTHVEEKIQGMADIYGAPATVRQVAATPATPATTPDSAAQTAAAAPANP
ncbi:hypothetical protein SAMN05444156_2932 [Verrucomicrobium sp. GAS474]|uniref:hypothetical protein n=1 Tax=Verrucomicrobium sp. GAS474 TaxID=1882831 RepID=UPI00087BF5C6|nr:hypothetical protein [Verrucomicrobium sp. GAS474]SDU26289.1 hypothetical protein SAMN05444156_2932 [Verrucomicrobium sp. GAS474]